MLCFVKIKRMFALEVQEGTRLQNIRNFRTHFYFYNTELIPKIADKGTNEKTNRENV